ncbi:hypothetical protein ABUE31_02600 [Mesorhizobium sp. ZMM04-5]|uniref:Uncharacterized protein n=1 Tax=Mesorhizobium marinum TaxID=3228790 RepID=A0ABV3QUX1_9HYPH
MDWNAAIEKNHAALTGVLAMLVAMAGLASLTSPLAGEDGSARRGKAEPSAEPGEGSSSPTLPRHLHRAVLALLRPAEAAARRLIIVAARGLVVALPPLRPRKPGLIFARNPGLQLPSRAEDPGRRAPALPLFDPLPRWRRRARPAAPGLPRISVPGFGQPFSAPPPPSPDDPLDAARLAERLRALAAALDDLPGHARRFARLRMRRAGGSGAPDKNRDAAGAQTKNRDAAGVQAGKPAAATRAKNPAPGRLRRQWPLRPGRPPGGRRRPAHAVHEVLSVLHGLAFWALETPDTS